MSHSAKSRIVRRSRSSLLVALLIWGCSKTVVAPDPDPETGSIAVSVATTGGPVDPDGYSATVGSTQQALPLNGSVTFTGVAVGSASVTLGGLASNCTVTGANPQSATVTANATTTVTFSFACARISGPMTLLATDREGTVYVIDETTGEATTLFVPTTASAGGDQVAIGVISSMAYSWTTEGWWLGFGGRSVCFGCLHTLDPATGRSTLLSDPSPTIRAVAGLAVHPTTGKICTTEADGSDGLFELNAVTGALSTVAPIAGEPSSAKGLTFSNAGLLYIGGDDKLLTFDIANGVATNLGVPVMTGFPAGVTRSSLLSMTTRESDGVIFAITRTGRSDPAFLATVNPTTGELTYVGERPELLDGLAFIPTRFIEQVAPSDASRIAFSSNRAGNWDVFTMDPHGGNLIQVTDDAALDASPTISPDRTKVIFASDRDGNSELYVKNSDGSGVATRLTITPDAEWDANYSPNGSRIAFTFEPVGSANWDLYSMATNGSDLVQLTDTPEWDANPDWSPDGLRIAFESRMGGGDWEIYTSDATTLGVPLRLTQNQGVNADAELVARWDQDRLRSRPRRGSNRRRRDLHHECERDRHPAHQQPCGQ
ncbi:MAG: hypothetical protein O2958_13725 [Gemmatimonadetes bacterium]|nr:hypothetical protein [Gemmatimonadota bacterium]MDA1102936.1 hypothetical protein [Gemmatimonadota bacterium]